MAIGVQKNIFNNLTKAGFKLGSLPDFESKLADPSLRKVFYDNISKQNINLGTYANFEKQIGYAPTIPLLNSLKKGQDNQPKSSSFDEAAKQDVGGFADMMKWAWDKVDEGVAKAGASIPSAISLTSLGGIFPSPERQADIATEEASLPKDANFWDRMKAATKGMMKTVGDQQKAIIKGERDIIKATSFDDADALASHYDNTIAGGIVGSVLESAPEILTAVGTGGISFGLGGYQQSLEDAYDKGMNGGDAQVYAGIGGAFNYALGKIPVFHALGDKWMGRVASRYAAKAVLDRLADNGGKALGDAAVNEILSSAKSTFSNKVALLGTKALQSTLEGAGFGVAGMLEDKSNKLLANKLEGRQIFQTDDFSPKMMLKQLTNTGGMMVLLGVGSALLRGNVGRYIRDRIAVNPSEENVNRIKSEIENNDFYKQMSPENQKAMMQTVDNMAKISIKMPKEDVDFDQRSNIIEYGLKINDVDNDIIKLNEQLKNAPEALKEGIQNKIETNKDLLNHYNDKIKEIYFKDKFHYHEQDGLDTKADGTTEPVKKYYKSFGDGNPVEIGEGEYTIGKAAEIGDMSMQEPSGNPKVENNDEEMMKAFMPEEKPEPDNEEKPTLSIENEKGETTHNNTFSQNDNNSVVYNGERGILHREGQTYVVETPNRIYEIGNVEQLKNKPLSDFEISNEKLVSIGKNNHILFNGKKYTNPFPNPESAIKRDNEGNIIRVELSKEGGGKVSFKGQDADDIAYNIIMNELDKKNNDGTFEQYLNQPDVWQEVHDGGLQKTEQENTDKDRIEIPGSKTTGGEREGNIEEQSDAIREAVPKKFILNNDEKASLSLTIDNDIASRERILESAKKRGSTDAVTRNENTIEGLKAKKSFIDKYNVDPDDVFDKLKKDGILTIDCGGKKFGIRK